MKRIIIFLSMLLFFIFFITAITYSGDGNHTVEVGDIVTIDNGWSIEVLGIFVDFTSEEIDFRAISPDGTNYPDNPYVEILHRVEGKRKFGDNERLYIEMKILGVSGESTPTDSPILTAYKKAEISLSSINEELPSAIGETPENFGDINKELIYKGGVETSIGIGDKKELSNGYTLKLDSLPSGNSGNVLGRFSPSFSIYDSRNNLIDKDLGVNKGVGFFGGRYIRLMDFNDTSVDLSIIDGSKIKFGTGWNLFSIPLEDGDGFGTILESSCNEANVWIWDAASRNYKAIGELKEGTLLPSNSGLFVNIRTKADVVSTDDCDIIVSGTYSVSTRNQRLTEGWHAIGSPITAYGKREIFEGGSNFNLLDFDEIKGDCNIENGPFQYIATDLISSAQNGGDISDINRFSVPLNNKIKINRGYFVKVSELCTLSDRS